MTHSILYWLLLYEIESDLPLGFDPVLRVVKRAGLSGKLNTWICVVMTTIKLQHKNYSPLRTFFSGLDFVPRSLQHCTQKAHVQLRHWKGLGTSPWVITGLPISPQSNTHHSTWQANFIHKLPLFVIPNHHWNKEDIVMILISKHTSATDIL